MSKEPKLGSGKRFQKLENKLAGKKNIKDPKALAASIGREKYGSARFQRMAQQGRKR